MSGEYILAFAAIARVEEEERHDREIGREIDVDRCLPQLRHDPVKLGLSSRVGTTRP